MEKRKRTGRKAKALTQEILSGGPRPPEVIPKWRTYHERLIALRETLSRSRIDLANDALDEPTAFSTHMADAGTSSYDRDLALSMLSAEQDALYEIDEAIARIRNGTYGNCEMTGQPIEQARLEAVPWTRFSAAAEKQLEREGALKRTQLGPRKSLERESSTKKTEEAA